MEQLRQQRDFVEDYKARAASLALRERILERQNINNYTSEYHRLLHSLSGSTVPHTTKQMTEARTRRLEHLGTKAVEVY